MRISLRNDILKICLKFGVNRMKIVGIILHAILKNMPPASLFYTIYEYIFFVTSNIFFYLYNLKIL